MRAHPLQPLDWRRVRFPGGFWAPKRETIRRATLPALHEHYEKTGRFEALRLESTPDSDRPTPHPFWDSDVAKWVEASSYALGMQHETKLRRRVDEIVGRLAAAQQPDGYLNSYFLNVAPAARWTNLRDQHELYCAGHLFEAAVAHEQATGDRTLLDTAQRLADHIDARFGPRPGQTRGYPGHEEIELALMRLEGRTGASEYGALAKFFIEERGQSPVFFVEEAKQRGEIPDRVFDYWQAHAPVRNQRDADGHAVRAMYLYCGMADVAMREGDRSLAHACRRLWRSATHRRMYVTGGIGSAADGERFTFDYDLPNETAYAETCAGIGLVFFAHRMLQMEPHHEYADVIERALYNNVLGGISLDGKRFHYANPLTVFPQAVPRLGAHYSVTREPNFRCSCCPPNVARLIGSLGRYMAGVERKAVHLHLYGESELTASLEDQDVRLVQETAYPWSESIRISVDPEREGRAFSVALRIPGWCARPRLRVNGRPVALSKITRRGYARVRRAWRKGDSLELTLPMPVRRVAAHPAMRMNRGKAALQRGPIVYCVEAVDNGDALHQLALPRSTALTPRHHRDHLGGVTVLRGGARRRVEAEPKGGLYQPATRKQRGAGKRQRIEAVPYFAWANRTPGEMRVWLDEA
jgi:DUF1680 family protein